MKGKPTYEELERRVQELEKRESEHSYSKKALRESENIFKLLYEKAPLGYQSLDENGRFIIVNQTWLDTLGYTKDEVIGKSFADFLHPDWRDHFAENFPRFKSIGEVLGVEFEMIKKNGDLVLVSFTGKISRDKKGDFQQTHCIFHDITERKRAEQELKKIEWMLAGKSPVLQTIPPANDIEDQGYGDLTGLNKGGLISRSIDKGTLRDISAEYLNFLESSSAIYEKNGDYAYGIFCSGWCRLMDSASRKLCHTENNEVALASGKWLCHESCWTDCSKRAIESQTPVDIECSGGIHLYAVPIFSAGEVIGAINFGYGDPPRDAARLRSLADSYGLDPEKLAQEADAIASRPAYIIEVAKQRLLSSARLIGIMVERKLDEESLREQRDFSESLVETAQAIILVLDTRGRIVRFNPYMEELAGYTLDEVKGMDWFETFLTPEIDHTIKPLFQKAVAGIQTSGNVNPIIAKDGRTILVEWHNKTLKDKDGRAVGILAIGQDITERVQAERNLRMAHEKLLTILDSIDSTVYVADMNTHEILFMNQKMITDFGGNKTGDICYRVFRKNSEPCEYCTNNQLLDNDGNPAGVCIWHDKNPVTGRDYINHDRAIEWTDGRLVRMQIATDITDLKKMEAQLKQAQKMESIGRLAGGVAHDFNNMLGAILGYTELAMERVGPDETLYTDLMEIQKAAQRSADLTRQLLAFARKQTVSPKVIDLNDTIENMLKLLLRLIGEDIDLAWRPGKEVWPIKMDPTQIDQILANLCVNARDAIAGTGKVTIETGNTIFDEDYCKDHAGFVPGEYAILAVSDNGCGMDQETQAHIFEPFFSTKEMGKGTGLGLATVYGVVKQNNGFVNVYSEPGQGTVFKIYLPRHLAKASPLPETQLNKTGRRGHETVLLVEDEPAILEMTTRMLERLGYIVLAAGTPGEAVLLAKEHPGRIDLLMTDVVMPEMNGRDLAKNLLSIYPDVRRLFMSGYTANVIAHHGVLDEGVHFIQKPFSMKDLGGKLREALND